MDLGKELRHLIHTRVADVDDKVSGILVQVPYFVNMDTINGTITLFSFDALGCTIREVFISFYMPVTGLTLTPTWEKTRAGDLVTFTDEAVLVLAQIINPGAAYYYSYKLGEIAQGLQGRFRILTTGVVNIDAFAVVVMEV